MYSKWTKMLLSFVIWLATTGVMIFPNLDAGGGRQVGGDWVLIGSLGAAIQTVQIANGGYALSSGVLLPVSIKQIATGDFNADGDVNFADFLIFAAGFGRRQREANFDARLDLNTDGEVNFPDFLSFVKAFSN